MFSEIDPVLKARHDVILRRGRGGVAASGRLHHQGEHAYAENHGHEDEDPPAGLGHRRKDLGLHSRRLFRHDSGGLHGRRLESRRLARRRWARRPAVKDWAPSESLAACGRDARSPGEKLPRLG